MVLNPKYHYDGDCGIAKFLMRLSSWTFNGFALEDLPNGYVEAGDFGPRVAKYDWFALLAKFPLLIALLVIAGITTILWLFWLCCTVRGLQKSKKKRHRYCLCFTTFLFVLLLLPLALGLYMTFRANYLLRRTRDYSKRFIEALKDEHEKFLTQAKYRAGPTQLSRELNKTINTEYADWQQTIAENEQMNFEHLKYLHNNRDFYTTALQSLKDYAYKLAILGLEMDDLLRTFFREAFVFLQTNVNNVSFISSKIAQRERINVWHLNLVYLQYIHSYEYLEHLLEAYENISLLQKSIAKSTSNIAGSENDLSETPTLRQFPKQFMEYTSSQESPKMPNAILYIAMTMFFVTAVLTYIILMALGFGICRYYERANCMLKTFLFLNILTIPVLASLSALHFLPTMVLHTGICHKNDFRFFHTAEPRQCVKVDNIGATEAFDYENDELSSIEQIRYDILTKVERMLPKNNIYQSNCTNDQQVVMEFPQEKWYENDVQGLITTEDISLYKDYLKEYNKENKTDAEIFSCKLNTIPNAVKTDLYNKEFVPVAKELYAVQTRFKNRAQRNGYESFTKLLESAQSELVVFEKFYELSKYHFLSTLSEKLDRKLKKDSKTLRNQLEPCSSGHRSSMNQPSKCGCLEDLLMIYAIGSALLAFTLFFAMLLSLLLYKLYKRGPPIFTNQSQPPKSDVCSRAPVAVPRVSEPPCGKNAGTAAQSTVDGKDCVVHIKSEIESQRPQTGVNWAGAQTDTPLINAVHCIPPVMGAFGCQQNPPMIYPTNCQQNTLQACATTCQEKPTQMSGNNRNDGVILPLPCHSRTQMSCVVAEAQLVGGGTTNDKTVTVMVFQGPRDRQPLVTYPPPGKLEKK